MVIFSLLSITMSIIKNRGFLANSTQNIIKENNVHLFLKSFYSVYFIKNL